MVPIQLLVGLWGGSSFEAEGTPPCVGWCLQGNKKEKHQFGGRGTKRHPRLERGTLHNLDKGYKPPSTLTPSHTLAAF